MQSSHVRILELTNAPELLALDAAWIVRVTFDLLLPAGNTGYREPLPGLASLGHPPMSIDSLSVDYSLAVAPVIVKVAHPFPWNFGGAHKPRQEMCSSPDLGTEPIL